MILNICRVTYSYFHFQSKVGTIFNPENDERINRKIFELKKVRKDGGFLSFIRRASEEWEQTSDNMSVERSAVLATILFIACQRKTSQQELEQCVGFLFNGISGRADGLYCYLETTSLLDSYKPSWRKVRSVLEWETAGIRVIAKHLESHREKIPNMEDPMIKKFFSVRGDLQISMFEPPSEIKSEVSSVPSSFED